VERVAVVHRPHNLRRPPVAAADLDHSEQGERELAKVVLVALEITEEHDGDDGVEGGHEQQHGEGVGHGQQRPAERHDDSAQRLEPLQQPHHSDKKYSNL